ncbi:MAG: hypothetical protein DCC75_09410 [Proteobacteria bacterium]|nr:MAG: hypothetical protein DCC75_09410 [Pseudomonadota bacterium]
MRKVAYIVLLFSGLCSCVPPIGTKLEDGQALSLVDRGTLHLRHGELDKAYASFTAAYQIEESAAALDGMGCVELLRGEFEVAERNFIAAITADPEYSQARGNLGLLYELRGKKLEARQMYQSAMALDPKNFHAKNNLAGLLVELERELGGGSGLRGEARLILLQAEALSGHPLIKENVSRLVSQ